VGVAEKEIVADVGKKLLDLLGASVDHVDARKGGLVVQGQVFH